MPSIEDHMKARECWLAANEWVRENPDAWRFICSLADEEASNKRPFSMQWLIEQMRKKSFVRIDGTPFRGVNNSLKPALSRILTNRLPHVLPYMTKRRSSSIDLLER